MVVLGEAHQVHPPDGSPGEVEEVGGMAVEQRRELALPHLPGQAREVDDGQRHDRAAVDHLDGLAVALDETGAQDLLAAHHLGEALLQHGRVERAREAPRERDVVGRAGVGHPVDEPQALLAEGERVGPRTPAPRDALGGGTDFLAALGQALFLEPPLEQLALLGGERRDAGGEIMHRRPPAARGGAGRARRRARGSP